jgi:hypothetical protein
MVSGLLWNSFLWEAQMKFVIATLSILVLALMSGSIFVVGGGLANNVLIAIVK